MKHLDNYAGPEPAKRMSDVLRRRGGTMSLGCAIYRLVRSESVFEKVGGLWHEWDADLSVADRGGIATGEHGEAAESRHRPDKVVAEIRETQVYSHFDEHGWVLERWYPASFFGSPASWAENVVPGTEIPILGPYPTQGRYLCLAGPFAQQPSFQFVEDYIADWEQRRANFPTDVEQHIKMRVEEAMKREEMRTERAMAANQQRLEDSVAPINSTTLEAGRWRDKMFSKAGFTSHIGS